MRTVTIYGFHDRVWHWLQAGTIIGLLLTGLELRSPQGFPLLGLRRALALHEALALLLIVHAALGLFYFVTSGAIRHYLPQPRDFLTLAALQARFYLRGIFRGEPHPIAKRADARLNPLQQATYLALLNLLLPLQVITGALLWAGLLGLAGWSPDLGLLFRVHALGAWAFAAFTLMHVYLTTTGTTPLANLRAMLTGEEELEEEAAPPPAAAAPVTDTPAAAAPMTATPATEAPATEPPATETPATEAPATKPPAAEASADADPAGEPGQNESEAS